LTEYNQSCLVSFSEEEIFFFRVLAASFPIEDAVSQLWLQFLDVLKLPTNLSPCFVHQGGNQRKITSVLSEQFDKFFLFFFTKAWCLFVR
jgi:hypothetical protein